jgi:hypothetical protein
MSKMGALSTRRSMNFREKLLKAIKIMDHDKLDHLKAQMD